MILELGPASLRRAQAQQPPQHPHHAGHGLGHCDRRAAARLRLRLRARLWVAFRLWAPTWFSFFPDAPRCRPAAPRRAAKSNSRSTIWNTSAGRGSSAQAHLTRSFQAKHDRLRDARLELRRQRRLSVYPRMRRMEFAGRKLLHRSRRKHPQPRRLHRRRRQEETVLRPECHRRKHAHRRHFLPGRRRPQARHQQQRRQPERQRVHALSAP